MRTYPFPLDLVRERSPERPVALVRPRSVSVAARWFQDNLKADVFYAVKANPSRWVIETLVEAGVTGFDAASIADELERLLDDEAEWDRRSDAGLDWVKDQTWDVSAEQVERELRNALRVQGG